MKLAGIFFFHRKRNRKRDWWRMTAVNFDNRMQGTDASLLLQSLTEGGQLEKWQEHFCALTGVFACCVDGRGEPVTEFGGEPGEIRRLVRAIDREQLKEMLWRVTDSELEDQAIETTAIPNLRLAVVSVKIKGKAELSWILCGVLHDTDAPEEEYGNPPLSDFSRTMGEKEFYRAVDLLRNISTELVDYKAAILKARAESRKSLYLKNELERVKKRMDALTDMVQLLESDDAVEGVMTRLLAAAGEFLGVSWAAVCRNLEDGEQMCIAAHWRSSGTEQPYDIGVNYETPFFLRSEKALVISENAMLQTEERQELSERGIKALIVLPVALSGEVHMRVCFAEKAKERTWEVEEITFLHDAVRVLRSILERKGR